MRRGPGTEDAYRSLTEGRPMERGRGPGPGPGLSRGLDRVASGVLGVGRSVRLGIGPSRAKGRGGSSPSPTSKPESGRKPNRVGSGLAWQIQPARSKARKAACGSPCKGRATRGERSLSLPGGARVGKGTHSRGLRPSAGPLPRSKARPGGEGVATPKPSDSGEGAASSGPVQGRYRYRQESIPRSTW